MQPKKVVNLPQLILNNNQSQPKSRELNTSSISQKINNYNRPPSYTFYQPSHSYSTVTQNTNKQYQKKEYHFVSEYFGVNKLTGVRPSSNQSLERQPNQNQQKGYGFKILNSATKVETPQAKKRSQSGFFSANSIDNSAFTIDKDTTDLSKLQANRTNSQKQKNELGNPSMVQSTIIQQKSGTVDNRSNIIQVQLGNFSNLKSSIVIQSNVSLASLSHNELISKCQALQLKQKQLQNRNYNLAQQLLSNESLTSQYEQKCQELSQSLQKYRKSEQSLKISRNIISTLNQKIARALKQNDANITNLLQKHQVQILELTHSHEEAIKKLQSTVFELKLKVIDQTNAMEQALSKAEEQFKINSNKQLMVYQNEINDLRNIAQLNQNEVRRLNQIIVNLQSDLMKLDEQNMRMDQQIARLVTSNNNSEQINRNLRQQIQTLVQQISHTHLLVQDLKIQNIVLKQKYQQMSVITQKNNSAHSTDEQKGFLMSNISSFEIQIKSLMQEIDQFKTQVTLLKTQKDELLQQLQQKEGEVAKLNITKGSLMLQNLKFKDKFKKTTNQELIIAEHDVQLQEITNLKSQNERAKTQLEILRAQSQQKDISLQQRQKELNNLNEKIKQREQELQRFKEQNLIQKEQYQLLQNKTQEEWSNRYEILQKQLQQVVEKCREIQILNQSKQISDKHQYILRIEEKEQKIQLFFSQLEKSSSHIEEQTTQIINLKKQITFSEEKEQLLIQMEILNNQLKNQLIQQSQCYNSKILQLNQTIQNQNTSIKQLQLFIETRKQQLLTLKQEEESKQSTNSFLKQKIAELELQLQKSIQIIQKQKATIEQLNLQMQMQEKDYRAMVEQQISKITMIYSEQSNELNSSIQPNLPRVVVEPQQTIVQSQLQESSRSQNSQNQNMSRADLINKIRELQFIKNSLQLKVQEINSMEQNLNDVIIDKLKNFEVNLQKNQQEKQELQEKVCQLTNQLQVVVQKCQQYQSKIQWVDNLYKEVQSNLTDTIQELIRTQALYFNLKLQVQNSHNATHQTNEVKQVQEQNESNFKQQLLVVEISQNNKQNQAGTELISEKQNYQEKKIQIANIITVQQGEKDSYLKQNEWHNQMIQEDPLAYYQIADEELKESQLNYQTKESKYGDAVYGIIISQVHSDSQEQQFQKEQEIEEDILQYQFDQNDLLDEVKIQRVQQTPEQSQSYNQFSNFIMNAINKLQQNKQQQVEPEPQIELTEEPQYQQENQMSNYIMDMIKNLQAKQNKKIAEQKRKKQELFKALQQAEMQQIESLYKQDVEIQQSNIHQ